MNFNDEFFNKVEKKTKVNKKTILDLAEKLNNGNMKNENTIREVIGTLSKITGKNISKEKDVMASIFDSSVGDSDQLPSVGAGNVLKDIIRMI